VAVFGASLAAAQAIGLDQHILRISKPLLRLVAKQAKVGPVPLFAPGEPLDQFEVDLGAVLLRAAAEGVPRLNLLKSAGMKTGVYRVVIRLTEGDGPRVSERDEYAFSTRDVMAAFNHDIEPLFPNDPQTYCHCTRPARFPQ
jgi:hypothetical protein